MARNSDVLKARQGAPRGVLLVVPPFHQGSIPAIGVSLLKGGLKRLGVPCDILYANLRYAEFEEELYADLGEMDPNFMSLAGDWIFAGDLFGERAPDPEEFIEQVILGRFNWVYDRAFANRILRARRRAGEFLRGLTEEIDWGRYALAGATSSFQQNAAGLAFLKRAKELNRRLITVFGGANCEGEMGLAIRDFFSFVDYVCTGEGDQAFPRLVQQVLAGNARPHVPGMAGQDGLTVLGSTSHAVEAPRMDDLPCPDYDDFFEQFNKSPVARRYQPYLAIETSRGCWWGEKHHCTFCGLNGDDMEYRAKSAGRVLAEIDSLTQRYGDHEFQVVDNILDMRHIDDVLGKLAERDKPPKLFYETKANLTKPQLRILRRAGVYMVQPGVESLSTPILRMMDKGVTGLQNVRLLKWCEEIGINPAWNFLYGFPGEDPAEYSRIAELIPSLIHLPPVWGIWIVDIHRFSPFFAEPAKHGFQNLRPGAAYRHVYPFSEAQLSRLAYFFDYDRADGLDSDDYTAEVQAQLLDWRARYRDAALELKVSEEHIEIRDARNGKTRTRVLEGAAKIAYLALDSGATAQTIHGVIKSRLGKPHSMRQIQSWLDEWESDRIVMREEHRYLSLAVNLAERVRMPGEDRPNLGHIGGPAGYWPSV